MSEGAANEARILISTDFETYKDFVEYATNGNKKVGDSGKSAFDGVSKAGAAMGSMLQGVFIGAGMELITSFIGPLKHGFGEAIADAEKFRHTITGVAVASGESIKTVGKDLEKLSKDTIRTVEDLNGFIERVRSQTGNRAGAKGAAPAFSKEARARGYESLGEMSDEAIQLQQRWKVEDIEGFYNKQRSGAKALGVDQNLGAETFKRMMPTLSRTSMSAEAAGRFSNALLRQTGGNMPMALEAGQTLTGFVGGHLPYIEKTLQDAGLLKKGESLHDEMNRADVGRALPLMAQYQKQRRGQKGLDWVSMLHLPGPAGALFARHMEAIGNASWVQQQVPAGQPLAEAESMYRGSQEGQNTAQDIRLAAEQRKAAQDALAAQLAIKKKQKGWFMGHIAGPAGWAVNQLGRPIDAATGLLSSDRETQAAGRRGLDAVGQEWFGDNYVEPPKPGQGVMRSGPGFAGLPPPTFAATAQDPKQLAQEQGKALGDSLQKGNALPVVIRGPVVIQMGPAPTTGQGGQH